VWKASSKLCGRELTIARHQTLKEAIKAKRMIDGGGCGGGCAKVHVIVRIDPNNSRAAKEKANIRRYVAEHPEVRKKTRL
jgi:hypothetical protein